MYAHVHVRHIHLWMRYVDMYMRHNTLCEVCDMYMRHMHMCMYKAYAHGGCEVYLHEHVYVCKVYA